MQPTTWISDINAEIRLAFSKIEYQQGILLNKKVQISQFTR